MTVPAQTDYQFLCCSTPKRTVEGTTFLQKRTTRPRELLGLHTHVLELERRNGKLLDTTKLFCSKLLAKFVVADLLLLY
jgi:hypothetical protein